MADTPKPRLINTITSWWQHSKIFASFDLISSWKSHSLVVNSLGIELVLCLLLGVLPFLTNEQIGGLSLIVAFFWLPFALEKPSSIYLPLGIYWLVATCATLLSPVKLAAVDGWVKLTLFFIIFLAFQVALRRRRSLLVGTYLLTALIVIVYGLRQWLYGVGALATWVDATSDFAGTTRIFSFLGNPNLLAGYLMPCLPLGLVAAIQWRGWGVKILSLAIALSGALSVILTFSRGGLIGLALESIVLVSLLLFWWSESLAKWMMPTFLSLGTTLSILAITVIPALRIRVLSIFSGRGDSSNNFRINVWQAVLQMIKARPILGIGPGNKAFNLIYPFYQRPGFSALGAYSVPLEIASEAGIIGLICYVWLVITIVRGGWGRLRILRSERTMEGLWLIAALSAIAGILGQGLFDTVWYRPQVQILWWLVVALVSSFL
jgi:putative inorganic carbon (hco3(-)) transporter